MTEPVTSTPSAPTPHRMPAISAWAIVLIVAVSLATIPLLWRIATRTTDFAADDSWAYLRIFDTYHRTGRIEMVGWNDLTLVGLLPISEAWTTVVGYGRIRLDALSSILLVVALLGVADVARSIGARSTVFAVFVVGSLPAAMYIAGTYMTDAYFFAGVVWAVACTMRAARARSARSSALWAVGAALACLYAFSIRQHAGAVALAAIVVLYGHRRTQPRAWWIVIVTFAVTALPLFAWRRTLEFGGRELVQISPKESVEALIGASFTLLLVPIPYLYRARTRLPLAPPLWALAPALVGVALIAVPSARRYTESVPLVHDLIEAGGVGWLLATALLASTAWTAWLIAEALRAASNDRPRVDLRLTFVITTGLVVASAVGTAAFYPRYLLLESALLVALLQVAVEGDELRGAEHPSGRSWLAITVVAPLLLAMWSLDRSLAPLRATIAAGDIAACAGIAPANVDGGFVWNGRFSTGVADASMSTQAAPDGLPTSFWQQIFPDLRRDAVVLEEAPTADSSTQVVGPIRRDGLIPGVGADVWLVTRTDDGFDVASCTP